LKQSTAGDSSFYFGSPTDITVPGDYDGDHKTDLAVVTVVNGSFVWWVRRSSTGAVAAQTFGVAASDLPTPGDYDGDGRTDIAVWRSGTFWVLGSTAGLSNRSWGQAGDYPVANFTVR
jgi:FG-GAP-like repeat